MQCLATAFTYDTPPDARVGYRLQARFSALEASGRPSQQEPLSAEVITAKVSWNDYVGPAEPYKRAQF